MNHYRPRKGVRRNCRTHCRCEQCDESGRARWFDDHVRFTLQRDVRDIARIEQAAVMPRLLERLAGQTAQVPNLARAAQDLKISERTADNYLRLLEAVFLVQRLRRGAVAQARRR